MNSTATLVRFWEEGFRNETATQWVDWDDGWFHTSADGPLSEKLCESAMGSGHLLLTVYSTDELIWTVNSTHVTGGWPEPYLSVHCVPWVTAVRHRLLSDDYMTTMWLQAETRHQGAS